MKYITTTLHYIYNKLCIHYTYTIYNTSTTSIHYVYNISNAFQFQLHVCVCVGMSV